MRSFPGFAAGQRCMLRRTSATRRQWLRWSRRARTCIARTAPGAVPQAASSGRWCHTCGLDGPSSRGSAAGACVRLCSSTALHDASYNGRTETVLALVKAGADVHCEDNAGYVFLGCTLVSLVCHSAGRTVLPVGVALQECLVGCAVGRRCTMRRTSATRRRRWRWSRRARTTCAARTAPGMGPRAASSCRCCVTCAGWMVLPV
jgi:hypothetical protein